MYCDKDIGFKPRAMDDGSTHVDMIDFLVLNMIDPIFRSLVEKGS